MPHTKTLAAGLGAATALAGGAFMFNAPSHVQLFDHENLTAEDYQFMSYVTQFGKSYGTVFEFNMRKQQFTAKNSEIDAFNADTNNTHTLGHNMFSDKTYAEMKKLNGAFESDLKGEPTILDTSDNAATIDWRDGQHGPYAVTPVKNQGQCGSCWTFSATGAIEGLDAITNGYLRTFSEQQILSCDHGEQMACTGGYVQYAYDYIMANPIQLEGTYPYVSGNAQVPACSYDRTQGVGHVRDRAFVAYQDADQLKAALNKQPVSVLIEADQTSFQSYTGGVITTGCGIQIDHAVLAIGYGNLNGIDYFLVKNSWGNGWGDQGYVRIGTDNACGILQSGMYPIA